MLQSNSTNHAIPFIPNFYGGDHHPTIRLQSLHKQVNPDQLNGAVARIIPMLIFAWPLNQSNSTSQQHLLMPVQQVHFGVFCWSLMGKGSEAIKIRKRLFSGLGLTHFPPPAQYLKFKWLITRAFNEPSPERWLTHSTRTKALNNAKDLQSI